MTEELRKIVEEEMSNAIKENIDSALISRYVSDLEQEISEKDKMIDLMAEELSDFNHLAICDDCEKICEDDYEYNDCKNCIIKYFKNKAKGEMK